MLGEYSHVTTFAGQAETHSPVVSPDSTLASPDTAAHQPVLHKLRAVRLRERVSLRTMGRRLKLTQAEAQRQEDDPDPRLSTLHAWAEALEVPPSELVGEPAAAMAEHLLWRAKLVQFMKTVRTIEDWSRQCRIRRLAAFLAEQMLGLMPELAGIGPLPTANGVRGPRPSRREERPIATDAIEAVAEDSPFRS